MEEDNKEVVEEGSLMDDLAAAWDAEENEREAEDVPRETVEPIETQSLASTQGESKEISSETKPTDDDKAGSDVAPKGLSPAAREAWANTPEPVRAELSKREKDFERGIQKYAENAKRAEAMDRALAPYSNLFAMNGGANNVLPGLLQTANALQAGSEHVRAQTVANLIQQFGVPISTLADILEGKGVQTPRSRQPNIQEEIQKALQPIFQERDQQQRSAIQSEIQAFAADPQNEFYNDVRNEMADIMDIAAKNGQQLTLKQAYDKACMYRDDIRQIIYTRGSANEVGERRKAATSITGAPRGNEAPPTPQTTRDYLEQAWDMVGKRV